MHARQRRRDRRLPQGAATQGHLGAGVGARIETLVEIGRDLLAFAAQFRIKDRATFPCPPAQSALTPIIQSGPQMHEMGIFGQQSFSGSVAVQDRSARQVQECLRHPQLRGNTRACRLAAVARVADRRDAEGLLCIDPGDALGLHFPPEVLAIKPRRCPRPALSLCSRPCCESPHGRCGRRPWRGRR